MMSQQGFAIRIHFATKLAEHQRHLYLTILATFGFEKSRQILAQKQLTPLQP